MNKADNILELAFAYQLAKNQPSALELHLAHERKLIALRQLLLLELKDHLTDSINLSVPVAPQTLEELIGLLVPLVNSRRAERKLSPYNILF
jgi:hypothetical protein